MGFPGEDISFKNPDHHRPNSRHPFDNFLSRCIFQARFYEGLLVVIVQDGKTQMIVLDATIEILTPGDTLITMLRPDASGKDTSSQMKVDIACV